MSESKLQSSNLSQVRMIAELPEDMMSLDLDDDNWSTLEILSDVTSPEDLESLCLGDHPIPSASPLEGTQTFDRGMRPLNCELLDLADNLGQNKWTWKRYKWVSQFDYRLVRALLMIHHRKKRNKENKEAHQRAHQEEQGHRPHGHERWRNKQYTQTQSGSSSQGPSCNFYQY